MTNIFLITVDDLRADSVGYINKNKDNTPNIDVFAEENVCFTNAIATGPRTTLSFPGILYSSYPFEYFTQKKYRYEKSLSSILKDSGYKTAAFNSNPHFRSWGFSKGFDFFEDFLFETSSRREKSIEKIKRKAAKKLGRENFLVKIFLKILSHTSSQIYLPYANAEKTTEESLKWIKKNKNNNLFCWIHYMDPHYPFLPPEEFLPKKINNKQKLMANRFHKRAEKYDELPPHKIKNVLIDLYNAEVKYFDNYFGNLIKSLKELNLYDDSVIVFTSDHGELFGDYGMHGHRYDVLYQKQLQVPLVIKTSTKKSLSVNHPVSLIDISYTISQLAGIKTDQLNGKHLLKEKRSYILSEAFKRESLPSKNKSKSGIIDKKNEMMISCQKNEWKLIIDDIHKRKELFNLKNDPLETENLFEEKGVIKELIEIVEYHKRQIQKGYNIEQDLKDRIKKLKISGKI